jgi:NADH:ubiquinone oxidoreductase subunit C
MPTIDHRAIASELAAALGTECRLVEAVRNEVTLALPPEGLRRAVQLLLETTPFRHLSAITVEEDPESPGVLLALYHFWQGEGLTLLLRLPTEAPQLSSLIDLIPGVDFYEREAAEMFGIRFTDRGAMPPLLLSDDWESAPPMTSRKET